jgi:hypothetical protein
LPRPTVPGNLVRPTLETRYHIDYDWWARSKGDLELYMAQHLCAAHRVELSGNPGSDIRHEWIDPKTGQILQVDNLQYVLLTHCSLQPDYISERATLVDAVFRAFLAGGNRPMTPVELSERIGRPAETILRTLSGDEIYRGLRPYTKQP